MSSKYLFLNTAERDSGTDSQATFYSRDSSLSYSKIKLQSCVFNNSIYNIEDGSMSPRQNNLLYFKYNSVAYNIAITRGNYSLTTLITALQDAINAEINPATVTITSSTATGKLTFTPSANTFQILAEPSEYSNLCMNLILGFSRTSDSAISAALTAPRVYSLNIKTLKLYLNTGSSQSFELGVNKASSLIGMIPLDQSFGSLIDYSPPQTPIFDSSSINNTITTINLCDDLDRLVYLNGTNLIVTLMTT